VDRDDRGRVTTFFTEAGFEAGMSATLHESAAHHARVKRLQPGDPVRLTDGKGHAALGAIATITRSAVTIDIAEVATHARPPQIHLRAPVADRERMLWLAEKATELGVASWQAIHFARSASVSPRGEGEAFQAKVRARMIGALEQSGGAWLPSLLPDAHFETIAAEGDPLRVLLDARGVPLRQLVSIGSSVAPVILVGPEGGLEDGEIGTLEALGWTRASLGESTLRFETAGIAAVAVCRALSAFSEGETNG
jgi:16S rRNA (uracil1498-N3)-methyltransferase